MFLIVKYIFTFSIDPPWFDPFLFETLIIKVLWFSIKLLIVLSITLIGNNNSVSDVKNLKIITLMRKLNSARVGGRGLQTKRLGTNQ